MVRKTLTYCLLFPKDQEKFTLNRQEILPNRELRFRASYLTTPRTYEPLKSAKRVHTFSTTFSNQLAWVAELIVENISAFHIEFQRSRNTLHVGMPGVFRKSALSVVFDITPNFTKLCPNFTSQGDTLVTP